MVIQTMTRLLGGDTENSYGEEDEHFGVHIHYTDLYASLVFFAAIYAGGLFTSRFLKMPSLVGEIFVGIFMGPNMLDFVPNEEAFVMLGEIGLILLVLEAGIDIDITTLRLIGSRGLCIALVGTFLPVLLAYGIAYILGFRGAAALAAGCSFAPTSLGIAMNVLRRNGIVNTPVGQLIVAAAIIDDMVALVILSQLQAFANEDATTIDMIIPIVSALGFLVIGGGLAVFVLPKFLNRYILDPIGQPGDSRRDWTSMAIMFSLLLALVPLTYYGKASPLMGAFIAGLVFCSDSGAHHMFVHQFKRVMQWLLRIFFAASIGFQVPFAKFGNPTVLLQGCFFTLALLGKVAVGFMVPNFMATKRFKMTHLRDCLVVGFSMAAEGEFAFVIAVFAVTNGMMDQDLYAAVVLAVLASTILAPLALESTISYFNKQAQSTVLGASQDDPATLLEKGIRERTAVFFTIQTKSAPSWGLQTIVTEELQKLNLDVIDHRSWHPRASGDSVVNLVNEVYVKDDNMSTTDLTGNDAQQRISDREAEIQNAIHRAIGQIDAVVQVQRWFPEIARSSVEDDKSVHDHILDATSKALHTSMREQGQQQQQAAHKPEMYVTMDDDAQQQGASLSRKMKQINHLDAMFKGRLEGLFRRDNVLSRIDTMESSDGIELLDTRGVGTGRREQRERSDMHGYEY